MREFKRNAALRYVMRNILIYQCLYTDLVDILAVSRLIKGTIYSEKN